MLVELASLMMRHNGGSTACEVPITQSDLADWIGTTRESTARALAGFRRAGLVETCARPHHRVGRARPERSRVGGLTLLQQ